MPTLVLNDVPVSLFDQIHRLAQAWECTPADTVLEVLETAFRTTTATFTEAPLPQEPFLTEEICAPRSIPRPEGEIVVPIEITNYVPEPHDIPDTE